MYCSSIELLISYAVNLIFKCNCSTETRWVTDEALESIGELKKLDSLTIAGCPGVYQTVLNFYILLKDVLKHIKLPYISYILTVYLDAYQTILNILCSFKKCSL